MGKALEAGEVRALLISLGFVEIASDSSVSGVEYLFAGVNIYQTSDTDWALDSESEQVSAQLASVPRGDGVLEQVAIAMRVASGDNDAPHG